MGFRWRPVGRTAVLVLALVLVLVRVVLVLVLEASKASKAWKASKACGKPQKPFSDFYGETYGKPCRITIGMPCRHVIVCMAQGVPRHRLAVSSFEYGDSRGLTSVASSAIQRGPRYPNYSTDPSPRLRQCLGAPAASRSTSHPRLPQCLGAPATSPRSSIGRLAAHWSRVLETWSTPEPSTACGTRWLPPPGGRERRVGPASAADGASARPQPPIVAVLASSECRK